MINGDILQVKAFQQYQNSGDTLLNVYTFQISNCPSDIPLTTVVPAGFGAWFTSDYLSLVRAVQADNIIYTLLEFNNLTELLTDFAAFTPLEDRGGLVASEYPSQQDAWSVLLRRTTRLTRHGHKRIGGVPESMVTNGVVTPSASDDVEAMAASLGVSVDYPNTLDREFTINPVIVGSTYVPPAPPTVINLVSSADYRGVGSQNSRKRNFS